MVLSGDKKQIYNKKYYEDKHKQILLKDLKFGYIRTLKKNGTIGEADINFLRIEFECWNEEDGQILNENIDKLFVGVLKDTGFKKIGSDLFNSNICCYMLTNADKNLKTHNIKTIEYISSIYRYKGLSKLLLFKFEKLYKCILIPRIIAKDAVLYWKNYFKNMYSVNNFEELEEKVIEKLNLNESIIKDELLKNWKRIFYI
jgi:hypothetical protein